MLCRLFYRFEAAWDSSLHNSVLLNRVTGETAYITLSAYIQVCCPLENCAQPAVFTKDLCVAVCGRDTLRLATLKQLFSTSRHPHPTHVTGVYELTLRIASDLGSPGVERRQRRVLDTSTTYVRGEENLRGWRPHGDALIFTHQWELEKMMRLEQVERMRHLLLLKESLQESRADCTDMELPPSAGTQPDESVYQPWEMSQEEFQLANKFLGLWRYQIPNKAPPVDSPSKEKCCISTSASLSSQDLLSPASGAPCALPSTPGPRALYVSEVEEVHPSPLVSRRGELWCTRGSAAAFKCWLVVRRPYVFFFKEERDPLERAVINLASAQVRYDEDALEAAFTVVYGPHTYKFYTSNTKEAHDWLYALNPLLAGQISRQDGRENETQDAEEDTAEGENNPAVSTPKIEPPPPSAELPAVLARLAACLSALQTTSDRVTHRTEIEVQSFDGTYPAAQFFRTYDQKTDWDGLTNTEKVLRLPRYLNNKPLEHFRRLRMETQHYIQVRQTFLDLYPETNEATYAQYFSMKLAGQPNLEEYYRNKTALGLQLGLPQEVILETLTEGLPPSDQRLVRIVPPENLGAWFRLVQRIRGSGAPSPRHPDEHAPPLLGPYAPVRPSPRTVPTRSTPPTDCRFCGGLHWHSECRLRQAPQLPRASGDARAARSAQLAEQRPRAQPHHPASRAQATGITKGAPDQQPAGRPTDQAFRQSDN
ncbi:unc-104 [Cordylochernes scorpioides]|uniref:Unc-104 n=1 Tax=Cordylochernes scorpioides TaxID=51811 RepID=A0ABY6LFT7_9ARAC|nr:unc-104 [Cordylochernes scorpioides]